MYQIVQAPHAVLSKAAKKVAKIDKNVKAIIKEMTETLENARDPEGVGLAAPQVGYSLQLFIIKESMSSPVLVFLNPKIIEVIDNPMRKKSKKKNDEDVKLEGCLSLSNVWGVVTRHDIVTLSYTDLTGKNRTETFKGFLATIVQHETDHLHGILFPKRVLEQKGTLYKSKKNDEGETVFEEISL
ncbi:MAG: peptide deformylase [bacterium]|nr:peptide deformylase [bacterium]